MNVTFVKTVFVNSLAAPLNTYPYYITGTFR